MDTILEPERRIPVVEDCDICVVGGSCTGVFAAVAAARLGAKVAIVECNGIFGGVATAGLVNIWHSLFDTAAEQRIIGGLTAETIDRLKRQDAVFAFGQPNPDLGTALNTAELTIELDALVTEAKVRPFLHTRFARPLLADGELVGIAIEDKTGRRAVRAKYFVDATGDGDLVTRLGLGVRIGDDLQPPTCCALMWGINEVEKQNPGFHLNRAVFDAQYPEALKEGTLWSARVVGIPSLRMVAGTRVHGANCADADELTHAEMEGRRQVRRMRQLLLNHFEAGRDVALAALPSYIGIRETRKVDCLHRLTEQEVLTGLRFEDAVANGSYRVDVHHSEKSGLTFRYLDGTEIYVPARGERVNSRWRPEQDVDPTFYQIPYRSLVPQGSRNVLVAGRMIDTDRGAHGATRVMVNTNQTGEAAGTAAYLALEAGADVAQVDAQKLRSTLKDHGAIIH